MDDNEPILHHTVSGGEGSKARRTGKGIFWPARHLARDIGPRPPGSQGERSASRFVERELNALGLDTSTQRFRAPATTSWSEMLVHLILVLGVIIFPAFSHLSFILICLGFLLFLLEQYGRSPFLHLQPHHQSENVYARIKPQREKKNTLVLAAHVDSPYTAFYYRPGLVRLVRIAFLVDFLCQAAAFMILTVAYGGYLLSMDTSKLDLLWHIALILIIPPALTMISLLFKAAIAKSTPGGNDNASGVAVLIELARVFARRHPQDVELWLVATGASGASGLGIRRFMRNHRGDLRGASFIILDSVGKGLPVCYRREGKLITFRANRRLTAIAKHVSEVHAHYSAGFRRNNLYLSEGFQLMSRGRKSLSVSSREESRYPRYWRCIKDNYDNVDPRSLRLSVDFVTAIVNNFDRENPGKKSSSRGVQASASGSKKV